MVNAFGQVQIMLASGLTQQPNSRAPTTTTTKAPSLFAEIMNGVRGNY